MGDTNYQPIGNVIKTANTGLDAIKRAPIVDYNTGIKCLRIQDVSQSKEYKDWGFTQVEQKNYDKFQLRENDIIVARTGASIGVNKIIKNDLSSVFNNGLIRIRVQDDKCTPEYLYYNFQSANYVGFIDSISGGTSTQPNMQINSLLSYEINIPPLPEQKVIASVLSNFDDKIDLLYRQNKTLEAMAETLFRQWFVEPVRHNESEGGEAQEDWEEGVIPDEFDFTMGLSPPGNTYNEDGIGIPLFQGNADFEFRFPKNRVYTTDPKRFAEKFDTLISVRAPVGAQNMAKEKCCIGRGVASFRYKRNNSFYTYTYFKLKSFMREIQQFNETGTVFGSIGKTDFQQMEIELPPEDLIENYETEAKPLNDKVIENCNQIKLLEAMRDTLLPKLMSGEVRIID